MSVSERFPGVADYSEMMERIFRVYALPPPPRGASLAFYDQHGAQALSRHPSNRHDTAGVRTFIRSIEELGV
eukprot:7208286-Pyramimonas_sp.AAC.1